MVTETADVLSALAPILGREADTPMEEPDSVSLPDRDPAEDERSRIVGLLGPAPCSLDDLVRMSGASPAIVRGRTARTGTRRPHRASRRRAGLARVKDAQSLAS